MNRKIFFYILLLAIIFFAGFVFFLKNSARQSDARNFRQPQNIIANQPKTMKISSSALENNANIPSKFTCDGENINPDLKIADIPSEAKSLALVMDDPDAPMPGGFVHWVLFNIDPKISEIAENSVPAGAIQGQNSSGNSRYTGPCPPSGTHHYHFKLYALDSTLDLDSFAKLEDVEQKMQNHILAQAEMIGLYERL